jgi:hypothetical protein
LKSAPKDTVIEEKYDFSSHVFVNDVKSTLIDVRKMMTLNYAVMKEHVSHAFVVRVARFEPSFSVAILDAVEAEAPLNLRRARDNASSATTLFVSSRMPVCLSVARTYSASREQIASRTAISPDPTHELNSRLPSKEQPRNDVFDENIQFPSNQHLANSTLDKSKVFTVPDTAIP